MKKFFQISIGLLIGSSATGLCFLLGLQTRSWTVLATANCATASAASIVAWETAEKRANRRNKKIALDMIRATSERLAIEGKDIQLLSAIKEIEHDINGSTRPGASHGRG